MNGVTVAYTNRGSGAPALFLHGNPDSRHSWEPVFSELGFGPRIIAPDFPGFGDSQALQHDAEPSPARLAEFWEKFVEAVVPEEPVHVVVHDFGGPWLLPWVAAHPSRVRSVFAFNTVFHRDYPWHHWAKIWQLPVIGELAIFSTTRTILRREMKRHAPDVARELVDATYARMHRTMRRSMLRSYRAYARPSAVFDPWEQDLFGVLRNRPVRVVWGDRDPYIPASYADRFGVEATHFPEYGHWVHLEAPRLIANCLLEFWASLRIRSLSLPID